MNNFQKNVLHLVPPWELCKLIPDGEFSESLFIWVNDIDNKPKIVLRPWDHDTSIAKPAPLLQEILENYFAASSGIADHILRSAAMMAETGKKATTSAMRLWLKNRGIEPQKK